MIKKRYSGKKTKKSSALEDIKKQKVYGIIAAICIVLLFVVVGKVTPVVAKQIFDKEFETSIDKELYEKKENSYNRKLEEFNLLLETFEKKYAEFLYAAYVVEMSEPVYVNDKTLQEMGKYIEFHRKEAKELNKSKDILEDTFQTPTGETNSEYKFLNYTLNTDHILELKKLYVKLSDITTMVNNSIVNIDFYNGYFFVEEEDKGIVDTAESQIGKISYKWGGKAHKKGWNENWIEEGNGLDCSGFVQWVYWTATGKFIEEISSTYSISSTQTQITYDELKPGDLGMMYPDGTHYLDMQGNKFYSYEAADASNKALGYKEDESEVITCSNHVGIYAGKDMDGKDIWVHCQGEPYNTVVKGEFPKFQYYYRVDTGENN